MKKYKLLSYEERVTIKVCLWNKMSINQTAKKETINNFGGLHKIIYGFKTAISGL